MLTPKMSNQSPMLASWLLGLGMSYPSLSWGRVTVSNRTVKILLGHSTHGSVRVAAALPLAL